MRKAAYILAEREKWKDQVSPVAWQHLNFYGRYEFRKGPEVIDINEVVKELSQMQVVLELVSTA